MTWRDHPGGSRREDGAKVGEFASGPGESMEWWAYPPGWKPRGTVDALGPFQSRQEAKDSLSSWLGLTAA